MKKITIELTAKECAELMDATSTMSAINKTKTQIFGAESYKMIEMSTNSLEILFKKINQEISLNSDFREIVEIEWDITGELFKE